MSQGAQTWRFPRMFWTGNVAELCERAAYYGTFIALRTYLIRVVGLDDVQAGITAGMFGGWIYLVPFFTGAMADRMGFRYALILAFSLLTVGYGTLGMFHTLGPVIVGLVLIVLGGSIVKPVMRIQMGVETVPFFSAGAALLGLILVALIYFPKESHEETRGTVKETLAGMWMAMSNMRFLSLILITAGFWAIQGQLYASMPDYVLRMAGETYKPEWYANINPLVVVIFVVMVTQMVRKWKPQNAILVAMCLIPLSAVAMAASAWFDGNVVVLGLEMHPITFMMVIGISIQGIAECFLSPKWLEFASLQAPPGKEGTFLGFAHMNTFFAWMFGFIFSGFLLQRYCPEPGTLEPVVKAAHDAALLGQGPMPEQYVHAHYLWYAYVGVGLISLIALLVFIAVTKKIDEGKAAAA